MSRSASHKEKYGKSSEILQDHYHEGTAARTRPLSFDEIMLKRKNKKKQFENEKEGVFEDITADEVLKRRKRNEQRSNNAENEASKKHSRELTVRDRHMDESRGNFERENKRKYGNGVYEQNRDRYSTRKLDPGKRHDSEASDRKGRKELSKSHFEELKLKRRRSSYSQASFGGSFNILSTNKNDSVDSVQLTQATRPMRRLYVENVPASASEKAVMECLNDFLISSCVNHIRGSQPCISCIINKEKGQALVEFLTPEDASAAAFDGSSFSGSIIKIRRPKDFVEVAIMEIASTYGPLKAYGFESSDNLNEPYAFLEYADHSVTFKACMGLNGMKLGGQVITAVQAVPNASTLETSGKPPFYRIPEQAMPLLKKPTQVLKLKNVFDPEALPLLSHTEIEEILEDVRLECGRFSTVKSVNAVKCDATPISTSVACGVNEDMEPAGSQQNLVFKETNAKTETMETVDCKIVEGSDAGDGKPTSNLMEDNPELTQQASKDGSDFSDDKVIDNSQMKDSSVEDKLPNGEGSYLEVVGGNMKESSVGDHRVGSDAIEKGEHEEQSCDLDHIFEPGCVFVEFSRTEASCMAAHCLHGRLFDNRTVTVEYVPLDVYQIRFPK
ncbi:hypothetical protein GH714_021566 [Hevea brasiliensis]|uniref:RRM domain-containing protein n=1 Tax=Hevea brasiliensis TaxID=3981 RepID=A0A6A6MJU0_HEVBR|nr:hypothetical protein GH714_021566 [Hevea brasiliensis]